MMYILYMVYKLSTGLFFFEVLLFVFFYVLTNRCGFFLGNIKMPNYIYIYKNKSSILAQKHFILFIEPFLCSHQKHCLLLLLLFICIVCYLRKHTPFCFILFCFVLFTK